MSINMRNKYDQLLKTFVNDNFDILLSSKKYRQMNENTESNLDFIPEHNKPADPGYIRYTPQFDELVNTFVEQFLYIEGMVFNLKSHFATLHGRLLTDLMDSTSDLDRSHLYFCRKHLAERFNLKILMDVFKAFIDVRDKETKPTCYFVFSYDDNIIELKGGSSCSTCDSYMHFDIDYTKNEVFVDEDIKPCKLAKKPTRVNVTLKSPSGKLVFLNHPANFFKKERDNRYEVSINSTLGCIEETKFYAKHNIGYFFIGNTTAYIMQKDGEILSTLFDEDDEKQQAKYKDYIMRGSVCTSVWWYTVLDYDLYLTMCAEHNVDPDSIEHTVVEIKAFKYKVSHSLAAHAKGQYFGVYSKITY